MCNTVDFRKLPIGGFLKNSLLDYEGQMSCIIFTRGCNFRCSYCHNPTLVWPNCYKEGVEYDMMEIMAWIEKNKTLLDAVVITGGEPTLHPGLYDFICWVKGLGLKLKLDTNGTNPDLLKRLIAEKRVDYVAMDVKAPLERGTYRKIIGSAEASELIKKVKTSIKILNEGKVDCEFRTTLAEELSVDDIRTIAGELKGKYFVQALRDAENCRVDERTEEVRELVGSVDGLVVFTR